MAKCKYYREDDITQYTPECIGEGEPIHPYDILGDYCQFCGKKIQFKENTPIPRELMIEEY